MKRRSIKTPVLAAAFIVSIPLGLMAQDEGFYPYSYARLSYVNGTVYVQRASDLGYEKGEINLALVQGDKMGTESGQAEVHFGRRNYLRVDDNTRVEFAVLPTEGDERVKLHLTEGGAYLRISRLALDKGVEVHTPDASFYVLEEGLYRFDVRLDRETVASVREGSLEAAAEDGSALVRANESVAAADGRLLGDPAYANARQDGFDTWNASRDGQLAARGRTRYLPAEIAEYEDELDQNGEWVYERGYGNVWVPRVTYADWRPYLYGRWAWYPVIGWTWVSSEPWGWSVYHYGRWHWRFGLGWYWIPRSSWGPAWVHWWWDSDHIGWCPLSWYNRPVLIVDNRFYDRYYDRYFPVHNRALTVVRRDQLQARDLHRREIGAAERGRIGPVELRREQPSVRPVVDNARPLALAAKRALADRAGSRRDVKAVAPSNTVSPSRMRPGATGTGGGSRERSAPAGTTERGALARPSVRGQDSAGRVLRTFPSQRPAVGRDQARASEERRSSEGATVRRSGSEARDPSAGVNRPGGRPSEPPAKAVREAPRPKSEGQGSSSGTVRSESASRSAVSRAPSRPLSTPSAPARPSAPSVTRPSSRPSSPSYSRPDASARPSAAPSSRGSYSAPSLSGGSSGRSVSASRSSSSPGRSIGAPRASGASSGRSVSPPRSGGTSSVRSSSPARSGSSPSRSSGSSSRSGSVKRKG
ncbi:MAG TPA: hypothetical protein PLP83_09225 [Candidatus Aminicenantes bacterium]|nr:hypothetical protein [Candidatus Aminicenantes bacterium]